MKADPAEKIIALIHALKIRAISGDAEAVEVLRDIGWHSAAALQSLANWHGELAAQTVQEVASESMSWPMNVHALEDARTGVDCLREQAKHIRLGTLTGYRQGKTKPRKLEPHHPTGWAFYLFGRMRKDGVEITADNAIAYLADHPEIQIAPEAIHTRAESPKHSLQSATRDAVEAAISSLIE